MLGILVLISDKSLLKGTKRNGSNMYRERKQKENQDMHWNTKH
jgi:hypothetical protein